MKEKSNRVQREAKVTPAGVGTSVFFNKPTSPPKKEKSEKYHPSSSKYFLGSASSIHEIHPITLKFENGDTEMAYQQHQQQIFFTFDGFKVCFIFCWIYSLCEVIFNAVVEKKVRFLYICVTISCFLSAHFVPSFAKISKKSSLIKQGRLGILYAFFSSFCIPVLIFGRNAFENDHAYVLAVGTVIANIVVVGLIFSMNFNLILICTLSQTFTAMMCFAQESEKWLPEQSRICLAYSIFALCCSRIIILQGRNTFGMLQHQKFKAIEQTTSLMSQVATDIEAPLYSMSLALDCLKDSTNQKEQDGFIKFIASGILWLEILNDEAKGISHFATGFKPRPKLKDLKIRELVSKVVRLVFSYLPSGPRKLQLFVDTKVPSVIETDERWFCMMLFGLLSNAKESLADGVIRVFIYHWGSFIRIEVESERTAFELEEGLLLEQILQFEDSTKRTRLRQLGVAAKAKAMEGDFGMYANPCGCGSVSWFAVPFQYKRRENTNIISENNPLPVMPFLPPEIELGFLLPQLTFMGTWDNVSKHTTQQELRGHSSSISWISSFEDLLERGLPISTKRKNILCWRSYFSVANMDKILTPTRYFSMVFLLPICNGHGNLEQIKNNWNDIKNRSSGMILLLHSTTDAMGIVHALRSRIWLSEMQIRDYRSDAFPDWNFEAESCAESMSSISMPDFMSDEDSAPDFLSEVDGVMETKTHS